MMGWVETSAFLVTIIHFEFFLNSLFYHSNFAYFQLEFNETYFLMNILKLRKYEVYKELRKVNQKVDKEK